MDFNLKTYKQLKTIRYFKTTNFFFFFHGTSLDNENWIKIEQVLAKHQLKYSRIHNKLMISTLKNSIFKNLIVLVHGPIFLLNSGTTNNAKLTLKELENINPLIKFIGFRLNNKVYSNKQIKDLKKVSYFENISILHNSMKTFTKTPYYKFKSKKVSLVSK